MMSRNLKIKVRISTGIYLRDRYRDPRTYFVTHKAAHRPTLWSAVWTLCATADRDAADERRRRGTTTRLHPHPTSTFRVRPTVHGRTN